MKTRRCWPQVEWWSKLPIWSRFCRRFRIQEPESIAIVRWIGFLKQEKYDFSFHPACETGWLSLKGSPECFISRIMLFIAFSVTCQNRWRSKKSVPSYLLFVGFWNCRERFVTNWWIVAEHKCVPTFTIKTTYACDIFCSTMVVNNQTVRIWKFGIVERV